LRELVKKHQIHRCTSYCGPGDCRFGFPQMPSETVHFDGDKYNYPRDLRSLYVNPYNPYLLSLMKCNMDIQLNRGYKALSYLCKYLTKFDTGRTHEIVDASGFVNNTIGHFRARKMGVVEAVYDIMGWHKQESSVDVIFVDTNLPGNQRRVIK
ncbi:hypothetical protein BDB00DRAFT_750040, partial [Zychaea mexicana]|uniref:uncharacterized protein n=1 Tax=Zychaea mexicana TaxID=64656 RepID=UPI0022FEB008